MLIIRRSKLHYTPIGGRLVHRLREDCRGHFARECPTRLRKEKKLSDSPGRKNPSERSKRSHAPGEKQGTAISGNECEA